MKVEELEGAAALQALEEDWRSLYGRCPEASPFQSPDWLLPWLAAFRPGAPYALAFREDGRLLGLLPLFIHHDEATGERQLTLLGNGVSDRLDLLAEPARTAEVAEALAGRLLRRTDLWTRLDWRDLPADSALARLPLPGLARDTLEPETPCPARPLPRDPAEVVDTLPKKRRENIRRRGRRLAELGAVAVRVADAGSLETDLQALLDLHAHRWTARGEEGVLASAPVQRLHRLAAPALLRAGLLRLHLLTLDGRTAAAHYGFLRGRRAYSYIHGFAPELAAFGPSTLLLAAVMEDAVRAGAEVFDLLRGQEPYKYDWGASDQPQLRRRGWR